MRVIRIFLLGLGLASAFVPSPSKVVVSNRIRLYADAADADTTTTTVTTLEPKEMVKLFGRLAEKYIMLDSSGGLCCYSGCSDCEFRLPGGGYRMADQSSARPKWIPAYPERKFETLDKEHTTKWSSTIYSEGLLNVDKETFVAKLTEMDFVPPLGGPYMSKSAGGIEDSTACAALFDLLAGDKQKLTQHRMSTRLKEIANGEEGVTWAMFENAMSSS